MKHSLELVLLLTASTIYATEPDCNEVQPCCPQVQDLQCDCGLFVSGEFLYWYGKENKLPLATRAEKQLWGQTSGGAIASGFSPQSDIYMKESWDPGFRVGIGWQLPCTDFSLSARYTYYHNTHSQTTSVPQSNEVLIDLIPNGTNVLITPWDYYAFPVSLREVFTYERVRGKWELTFHQVDFELDYNFWLTPCFRLRPFAGVRADWTFTDFTVGALDQGTFVTIPYTINNTVKFTNDHWGVGLLAGIEPEWFFAPCFGVYGLFDCALVWGEFDGNRKENYVLVGEGSDATFPTLTTKNNFHGMQGILDLGLGLFYTTNLCCDQYRLYSELGWEHHIWYHHVNRVQFNPVDFFSSPHTVNRYFQKTDEFTSDLVFGGLTFKVRFDF